MLYNEPTFSLGEEKSISVSPHCARLDINLKIPQLVLIVNAPLNGC